MLVAVGHHIDLVRDRTDARNQAIILDITA